MNTDGDTHLGRGFLKTMKKFENEIQQIELTTGAEETHGSVRIRSIRTAEMLKMKGVKKGDVILIAAVSHCDICIPFLASFYIGAIPLGLTVDWKPLEIEHVMKMAKPRMIFADPEAIPNITIALTKLCMEVEIVIFGNDVIGNYAQFSEYLQPTGSEESFECEDFDPKTTIAILVCSSGTTGLPKLVAINHDAFLISILTSYTDIKDDQRKYNRVLNFAPLSWITANVAIGTSCWLGFTRIISAKPMSEDDFCKASFKYNARSMIIGPISMRRIIKHAQNHDIKFTSFSRIIVGGSAIDADLMDVFEKNFPNADILNNYACTETMIISGGKEKRKGSCGKPLPWIKYKIVNIETEEEVGPNQPGELYVKSPSLFTEYYNDAESTRKVFNRDGWFKTGDMIKVDADGFFYYVERIKHLIKFRDIQVVPAQLENLISSIPGVNSVGVVGIPHPEDGEWPIAFVQLIPDANVTAQQIKDLVKEKFVDAKQLRGGVVFLKNLPLTSSGKIERKALNTMKMDCRPE